MFTTLRLKDSMEDVGKGPLKRGDALYQHSACIHCKRRKLRCSGDRPACARCQSEGVNKCTYPERKSTLPAKRKPSAACREARARKDSLSPKSRSKDQTSGTWTGEEIASVSDMSLESPIHALASANESDNGEKFQSAVEEQTMSEFTSLFEAGPDLSIEESELMLLESSNNHFSVGSDTSDSVSSLMHTHDLSSPSDTYDLDTYFSPITPAVTPADPSCTSWHPTIDFDIIPIAEKSLLVHTQMDNMLAPRCQCIKTAISALEDTPALADIIAPSVVESTLAAYKRTLATYEAVLRCKRCSTSTSATVTALVVGDELVTALSRLRLTVGSWLDDAAHSQSRSQPSPISSEDIPLLLVGDDLSTRRITVGAYSVDSHKEWASIISALIEMLLARLERVLVLVRARIREGEGEGEFRIMVVRKLEERVRDVMGRGETQKPCGGNAVFLDGLADCI